MLRKQLRHYSVTRRSGATVRRVLTVGRGKSTVYAVVAEDRELKKEAQRR